MSILSIVGQMFKFLIAAIIFFALVGLIIKAFHGMDKFFSWFSESNNYFALFIMAVVGLSVLTAGMLIFNQ